MLGRPTWQGTEELDPANSRGSLEAGPPLAQPQMRTQPGWAAPGSRPQTPLHQSPSASGAWGPERTAPALGALGLTRNRRQADRDNSLGLGRQGLVGRHPRGQNWCPGWRPGGELTKLCGPRLAESSPWESESEGFSGPAAARDSPGARTPLRNEHVEPRVRGDRAGVGLRGAEQGGALHPPFPRPFRPEGWGFGGGATILRELRGFTFLCPHRS